MNQKFVDVFLNNIIKKTDKTIMFDNGLFLFIFGDGVEIIHKYNIYKDNQLLFSTTNERLLLHFLLKQYEYQNDFNMLNNIITSCVDCKECATFSHNYEDDFDIFDVDFYCKKRNILLAESISPFEVEKTKALIKKPDICL